MLRSRQARRAEETSTPQEDADTLRGSGRSDDGCSSGRTCSAPALAGGSPLPVWEGRGASLRCNGGW